MDVGGTQDQSANLRTVLERTVPSSDFSAEALARELTRTAASEAGPAPPQQFLIRTREDTTPGPVPADSAPLAGLGTTSLLPPELLEAEQQEGPRFDILREAGRGGTAHVYTVADRGLGRTIALKLLRGKADRKKGVKQRFIHEARVTAVLEHPNIVPVYGIGVTDDNRVYFLWNGMTEAHGEHGRR
jgi:hypothetical protein